MLNYVWTALIFLGLAAALTTDLQDKMNDPYKNGSPINVVYTKDSLLSGASKTTIHVLITGKELSKHFGENISDDVTFQTQISLPNNQKKIPVSWTISNTAPKLFHEIAKASGKDDDISGEIEISSADEAKLTGQAQLFLEEASFLKIKDVTNSALHYADIAVEISIGLVGVMALWLGIMKIAEEAGIIRYLSIGLRPLTKFLFPEVPADHPAMGSMIMNISANILGLGNAATPFGLKAMEELEKLNPNKGTATNAMCTFLAINTAGMTLIPATAIALRASAGSSEPAIIIGTSLFGSLCATIMGIFSAKFLENFPLKDKSLKDFLLEKKKALIVFAALIVLPIFLVTSGIVSLKNMPLPNTQVIKSVLQIVSIAAIPFLILLFIGFGLVKKVKVYENFVEGAKDGFQIAIRIIPYLVAMLVAIGIFRAGGAMDWLIYIIRFATDPMGMPAEALPMALMRPLSGSGSLGVMAEIMSVHGPDSFIGILTSTFYGSSETTFYVLAVYFGAINIKRTRHALAAGLLADVAGVLGALFIVRLLFK